MRDNFSHILNAKAFEHGAISETCVTGCCSDFNCGERENQRQIGFRRRKGADKSEEGDQDSEHQRAEGDSGHIGVERFDKVKLKWFVTHRQLSLESTSSASQSSSSSESKEKKKTVGVRTDVTFEITSGETNDTKTVDEKETGKEGKDEDNEDNPNVIFFKGKPDRGSSNKNTNDNELWSVKPLEYPNNPGKDDKNAVDNNWNQVPQYAIWTTERYNHRNRHDQPVYHHRGR
jgi:hypothetical protein